MQTSFKGKKIGDLKSIIELQQKLLQQTENKLKNVKEAVQNTVQEEIKSAQKSEYASE